MNKDWLSIQANKCPEDIFLRYKKKEFSYKNFNDIIYDRTLSLVDFGVKKNNKVALYLSNPIDFIEAYLACYKIGAVTIVLNHTWKKHELNQALKIVPADYIICSWKDKTLFKEKSIPMLLIEELSKSHGSCYSSPISNQLSKNHVQSILFTSGNQGLPKPVCLSYDNFFQSSLKWKNKINLTSSDSYILCLPLYHIGGLAVIMRALHIGFSVNIIDNFKNESYPDINLTAISLVPTILEKLINQKLFIKELQRLGCVVLSGSRISNRLLESSKKLNLNIFISYGMTESCSSICGFWPFQEESFIGSVGKPFDGVNIYTKKNKIVIESNTIMHSYYNHKPNKGRLETQDIGEIIDDYIYIKGRNDNIVISGGENIDQTEVVNAIYSIADFNEVISYRKNDAYWGEISGVKIITNKKVDANYIKKKLSSIISKNKIPKEIIILGNKE